MIPAHDSEDRPRPYEIEENYYIIEERSHPAPASIGVFDDILTTGSHFKAIQSILAQRFPNAPIVGIFLARRVPETDDPADTNI
jgi:predicted amidophosphoribosyltransferase